MARRRLSGSETTLAASILYYDLEEMQRFLDIFEEISSDEQFTIDGMFLSFVQYIIQWMKNGEEKLKMVDAELRKSTLVDGVKVLNELQPNAVERDRFSVWLDKVLELSVPMELADEALGRFLWDNVKQQMELLDGSSLPFVDRVLQVPQIPESARSDKVVRLSQIKRDANGEKSEWFTTSVEQLDIAVKPVRSNFMVIASRPSVGKSTLMTKMALANAAKGVKVLYLSLEMTDEQMTGRIVNYFAKDNLKERFTDSQGFIDQEGLIKEQNRIINSAKFQETDEHLHLYINRKTDASAILAFIENSIKREHFKIVFIDYLQQLSYSNLDEWASLRKLTKDLKSLALRMNVLVVSASQVSRSSVERGLFLSDLFGSQSIEADTDIVIGLEESQSRDHNTVISPVNFKVMKNRDGERLEVKLYLNYATGEISDMGY